MKTWQLQDVKNKFNEVVENAIQNGPQIVTKNGTETVVILSINDYQKLTKPDNGLVEFFQKSPLYGVELDLEREEDFAREVEF